MLPFFYPIATRTMRLLMCLFTRWEVQGKGNIPPNGPLIIVANHMSLADPPLLSACINRKITFMAKEELFHGPGGIFTRSFGAFPVNRGMGKDALRQAEKVLSEGKALGMFPEGTRSHDSSLGKAEVGAAMIALRSGASIVPVGISGSEKIKGPGAIFRRPKVRVQIGKPFVIPKGEGRPSKADLDEASNLIMEHIAESLPSEYHGIYADTVTGTAEGGESGS